LRPQPKTTRGRLNSRRFRRRRVALGALLALAAGIAGASLAGAADPSLDQQIGAAQSDADQLSQRVDAQAARIASFQQRAREAGARVMVLEAQIIQTAERQQELAGELRAAEDQLAEVRARYQRAVGVLSDRLVEIYKSPAPDDLSVVLDSDGFDDLQSRAEYLDALHDADAKIADRVAELRDEVQGRYDQVTDLKASADDQARQLKDSRAEFASAEAAAEEGAAQVSDLLAANQADLDQVQSRLADLEAERLAQEQQAAAAASGGSEFLGGPYAIPTYIVLCESGGNYSALNPSSGAGGAYQILPSTWAAYGGQGEPQNGSKAEQDRIAAAIWADSGPSAWACA
jgi:peptidoglycan hydrolase CwlO-like protein